MTEKKDNSDETTKRTTATLDLKAKELKSDHVERHNPEQKQSKDQKSSSETQQKNTTKAEKQKKHETLFDLKTHLSNLKHLMPFAGYVFAAVLGAVFIIILNYVFNSPPAVQTQDLSNHHLSDRLAKLEKDLGLISKAAQSEDDTGLQQITALTERTNEIEQKLETKLTQSLQKQIETVKSNLKTEISSLTKNVQNVPQSNSPEAISQLEEQVANLSTALETITKQNVNRDQKFKMITRDIALLRSTLELQNNTADNVNDLIGPAIKRLKDVEQHITKLANSYQIQTQAAQSAALSLALLNLRRALNNGKRYDSELEAIKTLTQNKAPLKSLERYSEQGVPTFTDLQQKFPQVLRATLQASHAPKAETIWQQLSNNAISLVSIRRTGDIPGKSTEAILARMEVRIKRGDFQEALDHAKALKGNAETTARPWLTHLKQRLAVENALQTLEIEVLKKFTKRENTKVNVTPSPEIAQ
ncbi:MAG: mitofilin family membrane protein [Pseudomonadota bacterium]